MYVEDEDVFYYLCLENDNYLHPPKPEGCDEGILKGLYKVREAGVDGANVHLFGSGAILPGTLRAAELLAEHMDVAADVWSVTSYTELAREARDCERWNMRHPGRKERVSYLASQLQGDDCPVVSASDYVRAVADQIAPHVGRRMLSLGTDGFGRSETREVLREHFEVDPSSIALAAVHTLVRDGKLKKAALKKAADVFGVDPDKERSW